jgi:hypothetical protein
MGIENRGGNGKRIEECREGVERTYRESEVERGMREVEDARRLPNKIRFLCSKSPSEKRRSPGSKKRLKRTQAIRQVQSNH